MSKEPTKDYALLDGREITRTAGLLVQRIHERFPESGLKQVCLVIHRTCGETQAQIDELKRPIWGLRAIALAMWAFTGAMLFYFLLGGIEWDHMDLPKTYTGFIGLLEPSLGSVVFLTAYFLFIGSIESRWKQRRILEQVNRLRSLSHVIDMHQLTKDPERLHGSGTDTASSPERSLSPFLLSRYLDYCSEMLALLSKVSALWAQAFPEPKILTAVDEIEMLSDGLSRKIWQKLMILESVIEFLETKKSMAGEHTE